MLFSWCRTWWRKRRTNERPFRRIQSKLSFDTLEDRRLLSAALTPSQTLPILTTARVLVPPASSIVIVNVPDPSAAPTEDVVSQSTSLAPNSVGYDFANSLGVWDEMTAALAPDPAASANPAEDMGGQLVPEPGANDNLDGFGGTISIGLLGGGQTEAGFGGTDPTWGGDGSGGQDIQPVPPSQVFGTGSQSGTTTGPADGKTDPGIDQKNDVTDPGDSGNQDHGGILDEITPGIVLVKHTQGDSVIFLTYHKLHSGQSTGEKSVDDGTFRSDRGSKTGKEGAGGEERHSGRGHQGQGNQDGSNQQGGAGSTNEDSSSGSQTDDSSSDGLTDQGGSSTDDGALPVATTDVPKTHHHHHRGRTQANVDSSAPSQETGDAVSSDAVSSAGSDSSALRSVQSEINSDGGANAENGDLVTDGPSQWNFTTEIDDLNNDAPGNPNQDGKPQNRKEPENWSYLAIGLSEIGGLRAVATGLGTTPQAGVARDGAAEAFEFMHNLPAPGSLPFGEAKGIRRILVKSASGQHDVLAGQTQTVFAVAGFSALLPALASSQTADAVGQGFRVVTAAAPVRQDAPDPAARVTAGSFFIQAVHPGRDHSGAANRLDSHGWWGLVGQFILAPQFPSNHQPTIMLAVADEARRDELNIALVKADFLVLTAATARDAINLLKTPISPVDLALLDVQLPDVKGVDLCTRLRELFPKLPVMACADQAEQEDVARLYKLNVSKVFSKPVSINELLTDIRKMFA